MKFEDDKNILKFQKARYEDDGGFYVEMATKEKDKSGIMPAKTLNMRLSYNQMTELYLYIEHGTDRQLRKNFRPFPVNLVLHTLEGVGWKAARAAKAGYLHAKRFLLGPSQK